MFLSRVYQQWRSFFWVLLLFSGAQFFFMIKGIENTPFFLYSMFSTPHRQRDSLPVYLIKTPSGYFNHTLLSNREVELLLNNAENVSSLKDKGDPIFSVIENRFGKYAYLDGFRMYACQQLCNSPAALARYPDWWGRYFNGVAAKEKTTVQLVRSYVYTQSLFHKSPYDSILFTVNLSGWKVQ